MAKRLKRGAGDKNFHSLVADLSACISASASRKASVDSALIIAGNKYLRLHKQVWARSNRSRKNTPVFRGVHRTPDFQFDGMLTTVVHQGDRFQDKFFSV